MDYVNNYVKNVYNVKHNNLKYSELQYYGTNLRTFL